MSDDSATVLEDGVETTILDRIKEALEDVEADGRVFYGTAASLPSGASWDYTVFSRDKTSVTSTNFSDRYVVAVVREGYVPVGMDGDVIEALEEIPGLRFADEDIEYIYDVKPSTNRTIEMMRMVFHKARKRL